jgi:hypothetical protein
MAISHQPPSFLYTGGLSAELQLKSLSPTSFFTSLTQLNCWQISQQLTLCQSQSYFTTGGLPPISLSLLQAPWDPRSEIPPPNNPCWNSPYVTSSLARRWVCLLWIAWPFIKCTFHAHSMSFCSTHTSSVSTGFEEQIMPILHILCYNGSLVTWMVVSLTTAKFNHLIFSMSGFASSYTANMFILMILYDFCLVPSKFYYI